MERVGPGGEKKTGRWGGFGPRGEKEKEGEGERGGPARLKGLGKKGKVFHFLKKAQTQSTQIRIQEFEFKLNHKQNKMQMHHENAKQPISLIFLFMAKYFI